MNKETWTTIWFSPDKKTPLIEEIEAHLDESPDHRGKYLLTEVREHMNGSEWMVTSRSLSKGAYAHYGGSSLVRVDGKLTRPNCDEEPGT